ncbi:TonB-dependent receptor domain-containing protein [Moheibacter sediminis]|nr:TonB-dependent receptor [Moheibacter sediminis]
MFTKSIYTFIISFLAIQSIAQNVNLTGKVTDNANAPLEYVTVSIQEPGTYAELFAGITDSTGVFSIEVTPGDYILYLESFGGSKYEQPISITQTMSVGNIKLGENSVVALEGANIVGTNQTYKMELDKKVYDLSQDALAKGASMSDALQNVPSVQVDGEGNVSLRGNENVRILIDGKPSSMVGISDPATALQNLPADAVQRIEIVTNPSARYEAEGTAGIINIILKKGKLQGMNGSVSVFGGIPETAGASATINYRTGKWNLFTTLGYRYQEREGENKSNTTRFDSNGTARYENMIGESNRINNGYNINLGTEYYLDDRNTFTVSGNYRDGKNENISSIAYNMFDSNFSPTGNSIRTENEEEDDYSGEINFNFKHEFNEPGHEFTVDARASYSKETEDAFLREIGDAVNSTERSFSYERQRRVLISADYIYPFGEKGRFELGARGEMEGTLTNFSVDSLGTEGWISKPDFSNNTDYLQNVYAAYAQYGNAFGKFSFFAGLRMENSDITVNSILNQSKTKKNYVDFFPSLFLNYQFESEDQLQLSYSRRIRRPRGWDLIPFTSYSNNRIIFMGNPDLDPQYTDSYELSYITKIGKLMLTPNVYYSNTTDNIQRYQSTLDDMSLVTRPVNVGTEQRYGGDLTFTYRPWKWWNIMGNVNVFGYKTDGEITDTRTNPDTGETITRITSFDGEGTSWFGRLSSTFTLPASFSAQIAGNYRGGQKTAQMDRKANYSVDLSLSKDLFNDRATITFNVRDVFDTRGFEVDSWGEDFVVSSENRWGVRTFNLNFTYRFNQSKRDQRRQDRQGGMEDEMGGEM